MPPRRSAVPCGEHPAARRGGRRRRNPMAGACAVLVVGSVIALAILTGTPPSLARAASADNRLAVDRPLTGAVTERPAASGPLRSVGLDVAARTPARSSAAASRSAHRRPLHRWVRPFWGVLTSGFGMRWGRLHAGIDLAGPYGATIVAATDGCITYAGPESGYGEVLTLHDWDGTETVYGHMSSFIRSSGCVKAGQPIARIGAAGDATGPHLHFEVRVNGVPIDPIPFLARRGVHI